MIWKTDAEDICHQFITSGYDYYLQNMSFILKFSGIIHQILYQSTLMDNSELFTMKPQLHKCSLNLYAKRVGKVF